MHVLIDSTIVERFALRTWPGRRRYVPDLTKLKPNAGWIWRRSVQVRG